MCFLFIESFEMIWGHDLKQECWLPRYDIHEMIWHYDLHFVYNYYLE
jgi:hypothetical protein